MAMGATGYGFSSNISFLEQTYIWISFFGAAVLTFPLCFLVFLDIPNWMASIVVPAQVIVSFGQVALIKKIVNYVRKTKTA